MGDDARYEKDRGDAVPYPLDRSRHTPGAPAASRNSAHAASPRDPISREIHEHHDVLFMRLSRQGEEERAERRVFPPAHAGYAGATSHVFAGWLLQLITGSFSAPIAGNRLPTATFRRRTAMRQGRPSRREERPLEVRRGCCYGSLRRFAGTLPDEPAEAPKKSAPICRGIPQGECPAHRPRPCHRPDRPCSNCPRDAF